MESDKLSAVKLLACDVDGVLTDGSICYGTANAEIKAFNIKDGLGMKLAGWAGLPVVWLTGRVSDAVTHRAVELNVQVFNSVDDKGSGLKAIARSRGVELEEIAYLGDDLNDLPAMRLAGFPVAVADAVPEVIAAAAYVTTNPGGHGAIREVIEMILKAQNRWDAAVEMYVPTAQAAGGAR